MKKNEKNEIPVSLLAFTYFFAVTIFVFLLGYHYWLLNGDNKEIEDSEE